MIDYHLNVIEKDIYADRVGRSLVGLADSFLGVHRARCIKGNGVLDETLLAEVKMIDLESVS